jgi:hypothetical protein
MTAGAGGRTRFGTLVDIPTQSDKTYRLYAQPPSFGRELEISLVDGSATIATTTAAFTVHQPGQMIVGVVAEQPGEIIGDLDLGANPDNLRPLAIGLQPADLPSRVEAWGALDRLIWQDVDSSGVDGEQLAALRSWIAGGGRLVIVGGTAGPSSLSAFPDDILPYRPTATTDVAPSSLHLLLGEVPDDTNDVPALSGQLTTGRALASVGGQAVAAERPYGTGSVTILGFDPTAEWLAGTRIAEGLWRRLVPVRTPGSTMGSDDSQMVQAASQLPALAIPPIEGLVALLAGYILLIGPINYFVLRRLDKREWAWVTMPALIVAFAVGAYGFGSYLRGSDIVVNEAAIVRGSPGATEGLALAYYGVFSPTRTSYEVRVPGGALLSTPVSADFVNGQPGTDGLDVLQGDPSRIRELGVGFGSLRTIRAESAVSVPLVRADVRLEGGRLKGTITNGSDQLIQDAAVVLGGSVVRIGDLQPGATQTIDAALQGGQMHQPLADKVVGPQFFGEPGRGPEGIRQFARYTIVNHLTYDPNWGSSSELSSDGAVVLGWSDRALLPVEIEGQQARRSGNVLWFLATDVSISGRTTFRNDLIRSAVLSSDADLFSKDRTNISFGRGTVDVAYQPISFDGTLAVSELILALNFGDILVGDPELIAPVDEIPVFCAPEEPVNGCIPRGFDGLPEVELYDLTTGQWRRLPHKEGGGQFTVAEPARYVDPATGTVLIRYINDFAEQVGFSVSVSITGDVK